MKKPPRNKSIIAATIGTMLEYYDSSLYGFMAPILIPIFLPTFDPISALILIFIMPVLSIFVRPIGAIVIGRVGDRYGRKQGLLISIGGMTLVTAFMAFLPDYSKIGIAAPILFITLRSLQSFFVAGEYNGGAIFILEHTKSNRRGYLSGVYCACTSIGIAASAAMSMIISKLPQEYWRLPYLIGAIIGIIGLFFRNRIDESPKFLEAPHEIPLKGVLKKYKLLLISLGVVIFTSVSYHLPTVLMHSLLPKITSHSLPKLMSVTVLSIMFAAMIFPLFGMLADKLSIYKSMFIAALVAFICVYPLTTLISYDSLKLIILMRICFTLLSIWIEAPVHAWIQSIFSVRERYTTISFIYSVGSQIGSAMIPLTLWGWKRTHSLAPFCIIMMICSVYAMVSLYFYQKWFVSARKV